MSSQEEDQRPCKITLWRNATLKCLGSVTAGFYVLEWQRQSLVKLAAFIVTGSSLELLLLWIALFSGVSHLPVSVLKCSLTFARFQSQHRLKMLDSFLIENYSHASVWNFIKHHRITIKKEPKIRAGAEKFSCSLQSHLTCELMCYCALSHWRQKPDVSGFSGIFFAV